MPIAFEKLWDQKQASQIMCSNQQVNILVLYFKS